MAERPSFPAMPPGEVKVVPLGVSALSNTLAKTSSLPDLRKTWSEGFHGGSKSDKGATFRGEGTAVSLPAMATSYSQKALMGMSFTAGQTFNGRKASQGFWGEGPPKAGAHKRSIPPHIMDKFHCFKANPHPPTQFRRFFERRDLPIAVRHGILPGVEWKVEPERLDYLHHLPIFFDGLCELLEPYSFLAQQGLTDMLNAARGKEPSRLAPAIPSCIIPLKKALNTKDITIMAKAINMIQLMLRCDPQVGELLVPYYRQILPTFNLFRDKNLNLGDGIEYSQRKRMNMGDLIAETLELMERTGGEDAFINIKYMIPTYESCMYT